MIPIKVRNPSFTANRLPDGCQFVEHAVDLESKLLSLGMPIASHGRIDWQDVGGCVVQTFDNDQEAAEIIADTVSEQALRGPAMVIWSDAGIKPLIVDVDFISSCSKAICEEDWDCWIISEARDWIIEKYHEGEVCFSRICATDS